MYKKIRDRIRLKNMAGSILVLVPVFSHTDQITILLSLIFFSIVLSTVPKAVSDESVNNYILPAAGIVAVATGVWILLVDSIENLYFLGYIIAGVALFTPTLIKIAGE